MLREKLVQPLDLRDDFARVLLYPQFLSRRRGIIFSMEDLEICRGIFGCHQGWNVIGQDEDG